ncbi:MAG: sugar phosphate isomerase/epimerase [Verrucomicrobia bacterium]|nr:sugar phosphate isomerase/epimerase [Verrucomicrobiota bacterium]
MQTRRRFLQHSTTALAGGALIPQLFAAPTKAGIRIGARHFGSDFAAAKRAGMDGLELGVGGPAERLSIADPATRQKIKDGMQASGLATSSFSLDLLNGHPLFSAPQAPAWVEQSIAAAQDVGAAGLLVPFFGEAHLLQGKDWKNDALDALVVRLKALAPKAQAAGVCLGIECSLSAKQYLELLDRVGSEAVKAYYDIGNSTDAGFDVPADLRALKGRLGMIHFKDGPSYLGEGKVKMQPVAEAIQAIGYQGWIVLETANPSQHAEADCQRNAEFIRKLGL